MPAWNFLYFIQFGVSLTLFDFASRSKNDLWEYFELAISPLASMGTCILFESCD